VSSPTSSTGKGLAKKRRDAGKPRKKKG